MCITFLYLLDIIVQFRLGAAVLCRFCVGPERTPIPMHCHPMHSQLSHPQV